MDILKNLNDQQKEAVLAADGPLLILAGAGSGKTLTLTSKIAYLIKARGTLPANILAVTFTNKAAGEMKERVAKICGEPLGALNIGTFHSVCL
ncbi:MAG: ATP-dependent DNA helicase PcrA, partial [Parcubacteria group bacterium GW2011_GWA1_53_13]